MKDPLDSNFTSHSVIYNHRSCNLVAHNLAALGASPSPDVDPIQDNIPTCICFLFFVLQQQLVFVYWLPKIYLYSFTGCQRFTCILVHEKNYLYSFTGCQRFDVTL